MDDLARQVAQMALRLAALPPEAITNDSQSLDCIEKLALRILSEVASRKIQTFAGVMDPRETRGSWCIRS